MDILLVVHTEMGCLDTGLVGMAWAGKIRRIFDRISQEIGKYVEQRNKVYYLAEESKSPDSELIYPAIRAHSPDMSFIPRNGNHLEQYLRAKELLMTHDVQRISVSGVSYPFCVGDLYHVLLGQDRDEVEEYDFRVAARDLGWQKEEFDRIFDQRLDAHIIEDLTDKALWRSFLV